MAIRCLDERRAWLIATVAVVVGVLILSLVIFVLGYWAYRYLKVQLDVIEANLTARATTTVRSVIGTLRDFLNRLNFYILDPASDAIESVVQAFGNFLDEFGSIASGAIRNIIASLRDSILDLIRQKLRDILFNRNREPRNNEDEDADATDRSLLSSLDSIFSLP